MMTAAVKTKKRSSGRVWQIDIIRGVCVLLMVFDHTMLDFMLVPDMALNHYDIENAFFENMYDFSRAYWDAGFRHFIRFAVVFTFIFLSGISSSFSRSNPNRLRKLLAAAGAVSLVTIIIEGFVPDSGLLIVFGILYILSLSLAIYIIADMLCKRWEYLLILGSIIVLGGLIIPFWVPVVNKITVSTLADGNALRVILGTALYGGDCYGIFPYVGFFLLGAAFGKAYFKPSALLPVLKPPYNGYAPYAPVRFIGRNAIWVYLAHQVLIPLILFGAAMAVGYRFF